MLLDVQNDGWATQEATTACKHCIRGLYGRARAIFTTNGYCTPHHNVCVNPVRIYNYNCPCAQGKHGNQRAWITPNAKNGVSWNLWIQKCMVASTISYSDRTVCYSYNVLCGPGSWSAAKECVGIWTMPGLRQCGVLMCATHVFDFILLAKQPSRWVWAWVSVQCVLVACARTVGEFPSKQEAGAASHINNQR